MADKINQELDTIKTIVEALKSLDEDARVRVLNYAIQSLGIKEISPSTIPTSHPKTSTGGNPNTLKSPPITHQITDIRSLKEQKRPSTDIEMATLVAYYLKYEAIEGERKDEISTEDIQIYFVQAGYPLPNNIVSTLPNSKKAGYLENASRGKYKLNSVGHNLVAHNLPRSSNEVATKARKRSVKKATKKPSRTKKTSKKKS